MWQEISTDEELLLFMDKVYCFHDSCIKEMKYLSGAYVNQELGMYPVNDRRILKVIIQRQFEDASMIEMEFEGLKYLKLFPIDDQYTCEILDSTMILKGDCIYWCDCANLSEKDLENYNGTIIYASKFRWRSIENCMGEKEFYQEKTAKTGDKKTGTKRQGTVLCPEMTRKGNTGDGSGNTGDGSLS